MWLACRLVSPIISAVFGFQVEKCAQPHSVQSLRFRIPLQILSIFRYRHVLLIPHSALNFQAIPDSAKKKGPIPPFRQPENPPLVAQRLISLLFDHVGVLFLVYTKCIKKWLRPFKAVFNTLVLFSCLFYIKFVTCEKEKGVAISNPFLLWHRAWWRAQKMYDLWCIFFHDYPLDIFPIIGWSSISNNLFIILLTMEGLKIPSNLPFFTNFVSVIS